MIQGILKHDILSQCLKSLKIAKHWHECETFLNDLKTLWLYGKLLVSPPKKDRVQGAF